MKIDGGNHTGAGAKVFICHNKTLYSSPLKVCATNNKTTVFFLKTESKTQEMP